MAMNLKLGILAKIGAILFLLWGILHLWIPYKGFTEYYKKGNGFGMIVGKDYNGFNMPTDKATAYVLNNLFLNFVTNVGGYGIISIFVAYMLWYDINSWLAYFIGVICTGVADTAFLYFLVTSGIIEITFPVLAGPILWFLAVIITPIGLLNK